MRIIIFSILIFLFLYSYCQCDCPKLNKKTNLFYKENDSILFSGSCEDSYKNGRKAFECNFNNGLVILCKHWDKKGHLIDSVVYLDGFNNFRTYQFYNDKSIQGIITHKLSRKDNDTINVFHLVEANFKFKNGKTRREIKNYFDNKNRYLYKDYYRNGNLKTVYVAIESKPNKLGFSVIKYDSTYTDFTRDGRRRTVTEYKDGKQVGNEKRLNFGKIEIILGLITLTSCFILIK